MCMFAETQFYGKILLIPQNSRSSHFWKKKTKSNQLHFLYQLAFILEKLLRFLFLKRTFVLQYKIQIHLILDIKPLGLVDHP